MSVRARNDTATAMREFRVKSGRAILSFGVLAFITALTIFGAFFADPQLFFIVFLFVLAWSWYQRLVKTALRVRVRDDDVVEFLSPLRRLALSPGQISEVMLVGGGYYINSARGSVSLYGNMDGVGELLAHLQYANPGLEVKRFVPWRGKGGADSS